MRGTLIVGRFLLVAGVCAAIATQNPPQQQKPPQPAVQQTVPPAQNAPGQNPATPETPGTPLASSQAAPPQASSPQTPSPQIPGQKPAEAAHTLRVVVLDPAHGGADTGARGPSGAAEKNLVLEFARITGDMLRAQGFQVVLTRQGDTDPTFEERATIANAQSDAIYISLHVGSMGPAATARTYIYLFPGATAGTTSTASAATNANTNVTASANVSMAQAATPSGFLLWNEAQKPYLEQSRKLGDLLQVELGQEFKGSPEISASAPVYELRSVAAPAVAVEVSSIATNPQQLEAMGAGLADEITRAVIAYKTIYVPVVVASGGAGRK